MNNITAVVLAGGRGSRMGGVDKGLQNFRGMPLVMHALKRLQMQEGGLIAQSMINANRNLSAYESMGVEVWPDASPDEFAGPLSGFLTGLEQCDTPYLLTVPCDTPLFPLDLAQRLMKRLEENNADIAMASAPEIDSAGNVRTLPQPVFCLLKSSLMVSLVAFMQSGGRKIDAWTAQHRVAYVGFAGQQYDQNAFANVNTIKELQALE